MSVVLKLCSWGSRLPWQFLRSHSYKGEEGRCTLGALHPPGYTRAAPLLSALSTEVPKEVLFETTRMYLMLKNILETTDVYERAMHKHQCYYEVQSTYMTLYQFQVYNIMIDICIHCEMVTTYV